MEDSTSHKNFSIIFDGYMDNSRSMKRSHSLFKLGHKEVENPRILVKGKSA